jgi:hypothetical protein
MTSVIPLDLRSPTISIAIPDVASKAESATELCSQTISGTQSAGFIEIRRVDTALLSVDRGVKTFGICL